MTSSSNTIVQTKLDLSDSSSYLPSNLFQPKSTIFSRKQNTPCIQQLLLRRNRLISLAIYAKALAQLKQHLTELSLRENLFTHFPTEVTLLRNLTSLSLANNQLQIIESNTLSQLPNLQWLNLCNNQLKELPVDLVCCHHLRGLDVENNQFSVFPEVIFYLTRLEVLMLQRNKIKSLPLNYNFPPTLHTLNIAFNRFTEIPCTLLNRPPEAMTHLHLSGNKIRHIPSSFLSVGYKNLVSLDLHTCQLTRCPPKFFERLSKFKDLKRLNLAINRLTDIPHEIGLISQLQWLNLNDNLIHALPSTMSDLIHLVKLGLVQNRIEILPPFMFLHMLELQKLDIRKNNLKYMPPSILALAPRQEVDIHVDLAVPHAVFPTLSNPSCPMDMNGQVVEQNCIDGHPYGGSLRTLLVYENSTIEHVDGILCDVRDEDERENALSPEGVQAMSVSKGYSILQQKAANKNNLRQALIPEQKNVLSCSHPKFKRADHHMPSILSEIDDEENAQDSEEDSTTEKEERNMLRTKTLRILTQIPSLREICLRAHLNKAHQLLLKKQLIVKRLDQHPDKADLFIKSVLPNDIVPHMMQLQTIEEGRQCDFCTKWYMNSKFQIGYLARLCNNRLQVPTRFNICSAECTLDAMIKLHQSTMDWHTRQSLAHIDATLMIPSSQQQHTISDDMNGRRTSDRTLETSVQEDEDNEGDHNESAEVTRDASTASSTTTLSTVSTLSLARRSSLARAIRNRVSQFASTLFNSSSSSRYRPTLSISSSTSSPPTPFAAENATNNNGLLPLVFPNLNLAVATTIQPSDPPSLTSVTSRLVDGRLQTERTQPQLRLATPTPNPTAFNHLPRDAIRLEKF